MENQTNQITWSEQLNNCLTALQTGDEAKKLLAMGELKKMAQVADYYVQLVKENRIENKVN